MMVQFRIGRPNIAIAGSADFQAEIHIVEGNGKVSVVQSADLVVGVLANDETGCSDGAESVSVERGRNNRAIADQVLFENVQRHLLSQR